MILTLIIDQAGTAPSSLRGLGGILSGFSQSNDGRHD